MMPNTYSVVAFVNAAIEIYSLLIIARVLISWIFPNKHNVFTYWIYRATEPVLGAVRGFLPNLGGIDIAPMLVLIGLQVLQGVVVPLFF